MREVHRSFHNESPSDGRERDPLGSAYQKLWQEYVKHRLVNEPTDWHRYFQYSEIDPTCLSGKTINLMRSAELKKKGTTEAEVVSRLVEHVDMKDAAAQLARMADEMGHHVLDSSRIERLRIPQAAKGSRGLPLVQPR